MQHAMHTSCCLQVLDKQLQHTLALGYAPYLETNGMFAHVRAAVCEVRHLSSQWRVTDQYMTVVLRSTLTAVASTECMHY
jgi:hypothetical protein